MITIAYLIVGKLPLPTTPVHPPALAEALYGKGHDVMAVAALPELVGADDPIVLDAATAAQRCLVTENIRDFAVLVRQTRHAGMLFVHPKRWPRTSDSSARRGSGSARPSPCSARPAACSAVVQLASAAGVRVIAAARDTGFEWCRACGADEVLDYRDPDVLTRIADLAPEGVDVAWDNSGHNDLENTLPLLAHGARVVVTAGLGRATPLPVGQLYTHDTSIRGFAISNATTADLTTVAQAINHELARGNLRTRIATRLPLAEAAEAHRRQEAGPRGRIVVLP
jgi:hypothetical protein